MKIRLCFRNRAFFLCKNYCINSILCTQARENMEKVKHNRHRIGVRDMALKKSDIRAIVKNEDSSIDEKISEILDLVHTEVDAIKDEKDEIREERDSLKKEVDDLKANQGNGSDDWKEKYESEKKAFDDFKKELAAKETKATLEEAYRKLLTSEGVSAKAVDLIIGNTDLSKEKLKDGEFENKESMVKAIKEKYSDFIATGTPAGASTPTPPKNDGGKLSKADIYKKDDHGRYVLSAEQRQKAIMENSDAFNN